MGITFDLGQLVLDNEIAGMILHVVNGIPVNDITLAVDTIKEVGIFSDYLSHDSTYEYMRTQSEATLIDRQMREQWELSGGTYLYKRSCEKARNILETYEPPQLPDSVLSEIRSIIEDTEKELGV